MGSIAPLPLNSDLMSLDEKPHPNAHPFCFDLAWRSRGLAGCNPCFEVGNFPGDGTPANADRAWKFSSFHLVVYRGAAKARQFLDFVAADQSHGHVGSFGSCSTAQEPQRHRLTNPSKTGKITKQVLPGVFALTFSTHCAH